MEFQGFRLEIGIEDLDKVHIHEEIIPEPLKRLVDDINSTGKLRDPVIADADNLVVLDGMHRFAALREIGCRYLPVCLVDYRDPKVTVHCWNRVIRGKPWESRLSDAFKPLGLEISYSSKEEAVKSLEERKATAALLTAKACHLLRGKNTDIRKIYTYIKNLERAISSKGYSIGYETESDTEEQIKSGKASAALLVPRVRKEEVVEAALSGNLFAHKTTRHVIPVRPMNVAVPLRWLKDDRTLDEVNRSLIEYLSKRKLERLQRGNIFEGRRYDEELLVFR